MYCKALSHFVSVNLQLQPSQSKESTVWLTYAFAFVFIIAFILILTVPRHPAYCTWFFNCMLVHKISVCLSCVSTGALSTTSWLIPPCRCHTSRTAFVHMTSLSLATVSDSPQHCFPLPNLSFSFLSTLSHFSSMQSSNWLWTECTIHSPPPSTVIDSCRQGHDNKSSSSDVTAIMMVANKGPDPRQTFRAPSVLFIGASVCCKVSWLHSDISCSCWSHPCGPRVMHEVKWSGALSHWG